LSADLPSRAELMSLVRRFRIDGYDINDLVQEAYLCLLDPESDHDIFRHLRRLQRRSERRSVRVASKHISIDGDCDDLRDDNSRRRAGDNLDALVLLWAAESECGENDRLLLSLLAEGTGYRELCTLWHCNKTAARQRVWYLRNKLYPKLYPEDE